MPRRPDHLSLFGYQVVLCPKMPPGTIRFTPANSDFGGLCPGCEVRDCGRPPLPQLPHFTPAVKSWGCFENIAPPE